MDRNCQVVGPRHCLFRCPVYSASCTGAVENDAGVKESRCKGRQEERLEERRQQGAQSSHDAAGKVTQEAAGLSFEKGRSPPITLKKAVFFFTRDCASASTDMAEDYGL